MKVAAHPEFEKWRQRIKTEAELLRPWKGAVYRVTTLNYANPKSILLGEGSFRYGGRWNAIGSFRAVYGSTQDTVAVAESRANAEYAGMSYSFRVPRLLVTVELSLEAVLNLTDLQLRHSLNVSLQSLQHEDWRKTQNQGAESLTQTLGRAVFESGGEGLLAPSVRIADGVNVVYFPKNRKASSVVKICEAEKLDQFFPDV